MNPQDATPKNVFSGSDSIKEFLHPKNCVTPMVELPYSLNPWLENKVHIFAKCEYLRPLLNAKSIPVYGMLEAFDSIRGFGRVHTLVENTSGNTGFCLGILAKLFGIDTVNLIVPWDIAPGKSEMLRLVGAHTLPCKKGGVATAKEMGKADGFQNLNQYSNSENPASFEKWLAPQIWEQAQGVLDICCAGMGTTGTLMGLANFLKRKKSRAHILGVTLVPESAVPGVRTLEKLGEISLDWKSVIGSRVEVNTKESYRKSLALIRSGLVAGPSSGFAFAGLLQFLKAQSPAELDKLRNNSGEIIAVFVCPDTPFPYLEKYSTHLGAEEF